MKSRGFEIDQSEKGAPASGRQERIFFCLRISWGELCGGALPDLEWKNSPGETAISEQHGDVGAQVQAGIFAGAEYPYEVDGELC